MRILRTAFVGLTALAAAGWFVTSAFARGQNARPAQGGQSMPMDGMKMGGMSGMPMTKEQKIANALTAGPSSVTGKAAVMDWPEKEGMALVQLRAGTNGWTCFPDMPNTKGNDPACMDKSWMAWAEAYMSHKAPQLTNVGVAYMMGAGGAEASNSDPFAMSQTPANHWAHHPPHLMIVTPDLKSLEGLSTDPANGGPYVMFAGTPYAHIMAPVQAPMMMPMK
jgi:hypothetical protein